MHRKRQKRAGIIGCLILTAIASSSANGSTIDDLKKLDIICFVPSYLPKGMHIKSVAIDFDEAGSDEDSSRRFPLYSIEYENDQSGPNKMGFTIESAREGIGDRNLMEEEDSDETQFRSPLFGAVYIIYRPKGRKGGADIKAEIRANWVEDANMKAENARHVKHPILGRFHGFTGTGMTVAEFTKIVNSLHPIRQKETSKDRKK
jgi:hypothetical protein